MTHARRGHSATRSSEATTDPRANPAAHVDKTNAYGHEMHMAEIQMTKSQKRGRRGAVDQGRRTVDIEDDLLVAALARFGIGEQEVVQRGKGGAVEKLNDLEDMFGKLEM